MTAKEIATEYGADITRMRAVEGSSFGKSSLRAWLASRGVKASVSKCAHVMRYWQREHDTPKAKPVPVRREIPVTTTGSVKRTAILSDLHFPFEDTSLVQRILTWLETQFLHRVILNGDVLDCKSISKFSGARDYPLEDEFKRVNVFLDQLTAAARTKNPACEIHWIDGNHEARLEHYMNRQADKLIGIVDVNGDGIISIPHLLNLRARGITYRTYKQVLRLPGGLFIEHGDRVSKHSGYTAKNIQTDKGGSVAVGHVHRIGAHYKRDRMGFHRAFEIGCLCLTNPEYITEASANWQQGFMLIDYFTDDLWFHQQVYVQGGRFVIDGKLW